MPKPKIDRVKLNQMLRTGKTQREIAQVFGVTEGAVSKAKGELNVAVVKNVSLESAHRVVSKNLDTIDQLFHINQVTRQLLEKLKDSTNNEDRQTALRAISEIRNQLTLQLQIYQALYDLKAVEEFQKEVLETIANVSPEVRDKIVSELMRKRAIRAAVQFNEN